MTIFPIIQPAVEAVTETLPIYRETAWDYVTDRPVYKNGSPVIIEGKEALTVWIWNALHTIRRRHEIYTWDYGNDLESLIGQTFTEELKRSEAVRYVRECLMVNPYITEVKDIAVTFSDGTLLISCAVSTIYGNIKISENEVS